MSDHEEHRIRGFKATLSNPRTSAAAKEHARQELAALEKKTESAESKHEGHVLGGYKATLKNPHVSEAAKEHAHEVLEEHGVDV